MAGYFMSPSYNYVAIYITVIYIEGVNGKRSEAMETKRGKGVGRPRKHPDAKAASRSASAAYRERRRARRAAPEVYSGIIDLTVLAAWKVKAKPTK